MSFRFMEGGNGSNVSELLYKQKGVQERCYVGDMNYRAFLKPAARASSKLVLAY